MTLIIAKEIEGEIFLIADSLLSFPDLRNREHFNIAPKIFNFQNHVIAVSGVIDAVYDSWATLQGDISTFEMIERCLSLRADNGGHLDFIIIAYLSRRIIKITDEVTEGRSVEWIGSQLAFERFQQLRVDSADTYQDNFLSIIKQEGVSEQFNSCYNSDLGAFAKLVASDIFEVSGFPIPFVITSASQKFGYYLQMNSGENPNNIPENGWKAVDWGHQEPSTGSFSFSFVGSESGYQITVPQLMRQMAWHSPFVSFVEPALCPFLKQP